MDTPHAVIRDVEDVTVWRSDSTMHGLLLYTALVSHQLDTDTEASRNHAEGELNALTRAICFAIDPQLYRGFSYGLSRASTVWRALWDAVGGILSKGDGSDRSDAWYHAAADLANLAKTWPEIRSNMLRNLNSVHSEEIEPTSGLSEPGCIHALGWTALAHDIACDQPWVAEIELCPRCGQNAAAHVGNTYKEDTP